MKKMLKRCNFGWQTKKSSWVLVFLQGKDGGSPDQKMWDGGKREGFLGRFPQALGFTIP